MHKSQTSSNFGQIGPLPLTTELAALERLKISHRLIMGKCCLHLFSVAFDPILFILSGNEFMHKISNEFEFRSDRTTDDGVSFP